MGTPHKEVVLEDLVSWAIRNAIRCRDRFPQGPAEQRTLTVYCEFITAAQHEARRLGIDFDDRSVADFDAQRELLGVRERPH